MRSADDCHIVCALHPLEPDEDGCLDFCPNPELEGKHFKNFLGWRSQQRDEELYSNSHQLEDWMDDR